MAVKFNKSLKYYYSQKFSKLEGEACWNASALVQ